MRTYGELKEAEKKANPAPGSAKLDMLSGLKLAHSLISSHGDIVFRETIPCRSRFEGCSTPTQYNIMKVNAVGFVFAEKDYRITAPVSFQSNPSPLSSIAYRMFSNASDISTRDKRATC